MKTYLCKGADRNSGEDCSSYVLAWTASSAERKATERMMVENVTCLSVTRWGWLYVVGSSLAVCMLAVWLLLMYLQDREIVSWKKTGEGWTQLAQYANERARKTLIDEEIAEIRRRENERNPKWQWEQLRVEDAFYERALTQMKALKAQGFTPNGEGESMAQYTPKQQEAIRRAMKEVFGE